MKLDDQLVHEKMGLCWHKTHTEHYPFLCSCGEKMEYAKWPSYTTSIADAWKIVEWMEKQGYMLYYRNEIGRHAARFVKRGLATKQSIQKTPGQAFYATTAPEAIVKAFLQAEVK